MLAPAIMHRLRILHVSDLHACGDARPATEAWRWDEVLGAAWRDNLARIRAAGGVDLVCFTGDVAFSGNEHEYVEATRFVRELLDALGLGADRLFVVPGNHDIARGLKRPAWGRLRKLAAGHENLPLLSQWMAGKGKPFPGTGNATRDNVLTRQAAYRAWVKDALGRAVLVPDALHPHLGWRASLPPSQTGWPFPVHLIGLDSAWLAGDNNDAGRLALTQDQIMLLASDRGARLPGLRIALLHHGLDDLVDRVESRERLADYVDLLLHGHRHITESMALADPDRSLRVLAAGCLYESPNYPNGCQVITLTLDDHGKPLACDLWLHRWSKRARRWIDDDEVYRGSQAGRLRWFGPAELAASPPPAKTDLFVGRMRELTELSQVLLAETTGAVCICALQGMPGVGKSYLADHFWRLHQDRFPGGYARLVLRADLPRPTEILAAELADRVGVKVASAGLLDALRVQLVHARWLVHIENVDSRELAEAVAPLVAHLSGCAIIVTGRYQGLGTSNGWRVLRLGLLARSEARELLAREAEAAPGIEVPAPVELDRLAGRLGDLPLALHLAAGYLRIRLSVPEILQRLEDWGLQTLDAADPAELPSADEGDARARHILVSTFALSLACLERTLDAAGLDPAGGLAGLAALGWAPTAGVGAELAAAITDLPPSDHRLLVHEAERLSLLERVPGRANEPAGPALRLHPLLAAYLRTRPEAAAGHIRLTDWFVERLPTERSDPETQRPAWRMLAAEHDGFAEWLSSVPVEDIIRVASAGIDSIYNGPYASWAAMCERGLSGIPDEAVRSGLLFILAHVLRRMGEFDRAERAAQDKQRLDQGRGAERAATQAMAIRADILQDRGDHNEALRIRQELIPIYEKRGDLFNRAVTLGKIADILQARGDFAEALRIRQEEELPVYEEQGAVLYRAATLAKIAEIVHVHGSRSDLDKALRILTQEVIPVFEQYGSVRDRAMSLSLAAQVLAARNAIGDCDDALGILQQDVIPAFEKLGAMRDRAFAFGLVADIHHARGDCAEALRIRQQDVIPAFEKLGAMRDRAITAAKVADILAARNHVGDRAEALRILQQDVIPILEKAGSEHHLVGARTNTAILLHHQGNTVDAAGIIRLALTDAERQQHPELDVVRQWHRTICSGGLV
jgi:tetratricopeptide (TPR) repeat protein